VAPTSTKGVLITCLDRDRYLRFSLKTIREMRDEFGEDALEKGINQEAISRLLWYGLRHEDSELTADQVEEMVDLEHLSEVMEAVAKATGRRAKIEVEQPGPPTPAAEPESTPPADPIPAEPPPVVAGEGEAQTIET